MKKFVFPLCILILLMTSCENNGITDKSEKQEDEQFLGQLYQEIVDLSESVTCEDPENWEFTPIGHKSCGGPAGYIAYSTTIDVEDFLDQVAFFSEQQKTYNEKWGIFSTCNLTPQPEEVACEDGKPVLIY